MPWVVGQSRRAGTRRRSRVNLLYLEQRVTGKVRILFTIPNFVTAGSGQAMVNIIDRLDRNRFEPAVAVATPGGALMDHLRESGVEVIEAPFSVEPRPIASLLFRIWAAQRSFRGRFDIWHSFNWRGEFTEPLVAYASGAHAWVYTKKNMGFATKSWRIRSLLARRIAVQNDEMTRLFFNRPWFRHKVRYIPTGIDVEAWQGAPRDIGFRERHGIPDSAVVIVCVGDVQPRKNQASLVPALSELSSAHLVLAGRSLDAGYTTDLQRTAAEFGVSDRVHLAGPVSDVPGMLKCCDIFALPSHAEGSPIAMVEAMAIGLPGVYSAIPGIRERVSDCHDGFLVGPTDQDSITSRLGELVGSADLRRRMGQAAQETVAMRGRVEAEEARYETLYLELVH